MTKCECTNAIYYQQEHNGYDLLKESRSYHAAKKANDANEELKKMSTLRNYELHSKILTSCQYQSIDR